MSILAPMLLLAAAPAAAVPPPPLTEPNEITVVAERLADWKGGVAKRDGGLVCRTRTSTGDPQLDAIRCNAMLTCIRPIEDEIDTVMKSDLPRSIKRERFDALVQNTLPCVEVRQDEAVAEMLAERRLGSAGQ